MKKRSKSHRGHPAGGGVAVAQAQALDGPLNRQGRASEAEPEPEQSATRFLVYWMGIPFALLILLVVYRVFISGIQ